VCVRCDGGGGWFGLGVRREERGEGRGERGEGKGRGDEGRGWG